MTGGYIYICMGKLEMSTDSCTCEDTKCQRQTRATSLSSHSQHQALSGISICVLQDVVLWAALSVTVLGFYYWSTLYTHNGPDQYCNGSGIKGMKMAISNLVSLDDPPPPPPHPTNIAPASKSALSVKFYNLTCSPPPPPPQSFKFQMKTNMVIDQMHYINAYNYIILIFWNNSCDEIVHSLLHSARLPGPPTSQYCTREQELEGRQKFSFSCPVNHDGYM